MSPSGQVAGAMRESRKMPASRSDIRPSLIDIERGKGLGIILVVYGHLVMFGTYGEQGWYAASKDAIYLFHMPFFLYLSGYVFSYVDAAGRAREAFGRFLRRRANRLLVPFFVSAIVIVTGKYVVSTHFEVDQAVTGYFQGYISLFIGTENSPVLSIWYLYVLFAYSILTPLLLTLTGGRIFPILLIALLFYFLPVTEDFFIFRIFHYFVFFVLGWIACSYRSAILPLYGRFAVPLVAAFAVSLFLDRDWYPSVLISGALSLPALHGFLRQRWMESDRVLVFFGRYSMVIYLLNTIFIGVSKIIYVRFFSFDGPFFVLFVAVIFLSGIFGPIGARILIGRFDGRAVITRYLD